METFSPHNSDSQRFFLSCFLSHLSKELVNSCDHWPSLSAYFKEILSDNSIRRRKHLLFSIHEDRRIAFFMEIVVGCEEVLIDYFHGENITYVCNGE